MSRDPDPSAGPDKFSYFINEVSRLLSQDESVLPFDSKDREASNIAGSLFENGTLANLSDFRKQKVNSLLEQALGTYKQEFEVTLDPILSMCRLKALLQNKRAGPDDGASQSVFDSSGTKRKREDQLESTIGVDEENEEEEDLKILLESDPAFVEAIMKKNSDDVYASLNHMEKQLEGLVNAVVSKSRPMIPAEKYQLRNMLRDLPPQNMDRVAEIVQQGKPDEKEPRDGIHVEMEKEDNAKLWRLYYYVEAVKKAGKDVSND